MPKYSLIGEETDDICFSYYVVIDLECPPADDGERCTLRRDYICQVYGKDNGELIAAALNEQDDACSDGSCP